MIHYIGLFSTCIVSAYVFFDFAETLYERAYTKKIIYFIAYMIYLAISFLVSFFRISVLNAFCTTVLIGLIIRFTYNTKKKNVLINYILFFLYIVATDTIISILFSFLALSNTYITTDNPHIYLTSGIAGSITLLCTHKIIIRMIQKDSSTKISRILNGYMIFLLIFEIAVISYLLYINFYILPMFLISMGFIVIDIGVFSGCQLFSKIALLEKQNQLLEQQENMTVKYYEDLQVKYNDTHKLLHDIKKHIQVIKSLEIYDDNVKKLYANNLIKSLDEVEQQFQCSNKIINAIIWDKIQRCQQLNIKFDIDMQDIDFDFMSNLEITMLFVNLLDNAIEACETSEDSIKEINLRIHKFKDYIVLKLKNTSGNRPVNKSGRLISTKPGHKGLGMLILEELVDKYSGNINYDYSEHYFETNIIFLSIK